MFYGLTYISDLSTNKKSGSAFDIITILKRRLQKNFYSNKKSEGRIVYQIMSYHRIDQARQELEIAKRNLELAENSVKMEVPAMTINQPMQAAGGRSVVYGELNFGHIEDITNGWERRFEELTIKHEKLATRVKDCEMELEIKQGGDVGDLRDKLTDVNERHEFGRSSLYEGGRRHDRRAPLQNRDGRSGGYGSYGVERREYQSYEFRGRGSYGRSRERNEYKPRKYAN